MAVKGKITAEEFLRTYPEESRVELLEGEVFEMPAPSVYHQRILFRLARLLQQFVEEADRGEVLISPVDVVFSEDTVLQPDLVYVADLSKVKDKVWGVPDLVVEVVSPSTLKRDLVDKMKVYESSGVKEYWLVFPLEKTIMVYSLQDKGYELFSYATEKGKVASRLLQGLQVDLQEVFQDL